jgi:hypothetical protein
MVEAFFKVLSQHSLSGTEENLQNFSSASPNLEFRNSGMQVEMSPLDLTWRDMSLTSLSLTEIV